MLLDSNVLVYATRGDSPHLLDFIEADVTAAVSAISRVETLGFPGLSTDEEEALEWVFLTVSVLPVDTPVLDEAIRSRRLRRMSLGDSIIAATALLHELPLATRNTRDFAWIPGLRLHNPVDV